MSNLIKFDDFNDSSIRVTDDGRYSVYDVIRFCSGLKNPSQFWNGDKSARTTRQKGLVERFPEVIRKTEGFKFPGRGQKETPVANRENILYILGLLPGAIGRAYREEAAKVFVQYIDASPELAESVIDRATPKDLERIEKRLRSKQIRISFTQTLADHGISEGWEFATITNSIYQPLLGGTAKEVRQKKNLPAKQNLRDGLSNVELSAVMLAESLAEHDIDVNALFGFNQCNNATKSAASKVARVFE